MAKEEISTLPDDAQRRNFVRSMLEDVRALERMIEEGIRRAAEAGDDVAAHLIAGRAMSARASKKRRRSAAAE